MSLSELLEKKIKELEEMSSTGGGEVAGGGGERGRKKRAGESEEDEEDKLDHVQAAGYKKVKESKFKKYATATFLNEVSYKEYKGNQEQTSKQKVNQSIKEVGSKLLKIERIINQNIKLKTEEGIDNKQYWKSTRGGLYKISERMMRISEKLRRF